MLTLRRVSAKAFEVSWDGRLAGTVGYVRATNDWAARIEIPELYVPHYYAPTRFRGKTFANVKNQIKTFFNKTVPERADKLLP
jgi:hypothetical protein